MKWAYFNDYRYRQDSAKSDDSRWVHRLPADPQRYEQRFNPGSIPGRIYQGLRDLIKRRKKEPLFSCNSPVFFDCGNPHIFGYIRRDDQRQIVLVNNFSDHPQTVAQNALRLSGLGPEFMDELGGEFYTMDEGLTLKPFQYFWLRNRQA